MNGKPAEEPTGGQVTSGFRDYLGLERNVVVMVLAGSLQGLATALWGGFLPKVLRALGATGAMIGVFGTIEAGMSAVAPYPGGLLSDRLGRGRALILASALAMGGYFIFLVAPVWWAFIPGAVLLGFAGSFRFMGSLALTGDQLPEDRRAISIGVQSILTRLPNVISPPLGGTLIVGLGLLAGFRLALAITLALSVVAILVQRRYYQLPPAPLQEGSLHPLVVFRSMSGELKRLLLADCFIRFGCGMYSNFVVLYVMDVLRRGAVEFGSLQALEAATMMVLYIPAGKWADRAGRASRRPFIAATFLFFAAFPLALAIVPRAVWLIPAFIIAGLRELGEPARKALILDLAPGASRGREMGTYYMLRGIFMSLAPLVGGLLWDWKPTAPFLVGGLVSGLGLFWFLLEGLLFGNEEQETSGHSSRSTR